MEVGRIQGGNLNWSRAHFGAWCVVSAPLILGLDLTDVSTMNTIIGFISNPEAIAINQQWAGHPGRLVKQITSNTTALPIQVWAKPQPQGQLAVYVVNPTPPSGYRAPDPLGCFREFPAAAKQNNICFGQYKITYPAVGTRASCAVECLQDSACTAFVWALPGEGGDKCRISHTCTTPTGYLGGFDGYIRTPSVAGCGVQPEPPSKPVEVVVTFSELGLGQNVTSAGVRDVWARQTLAATAGAQLNVTVSPMDSVFVVLTPK